MAKALADSLGVQIKDFQKQLEAAREEIRLEYREQLERHRKEAATQQAEIREQLEAKLETERVQLMDQLKAAQEEARRGEGAARVAAEQQARQLERRLEKLMEEQKAALDKQRAADEAARKEEVTDLNQQIAVLRRKLTAIEGAESALSPPGSATAQELKEELKEVLSSKEAEIKKLQAEDEEHDDPRDEQEPAGAEMEAATGGTAASNNAPGSDSASSPHPPRDEL
eukprot:2569512-Prymnesium_polylepis.1